MGITRFFSKSLSRKIFLILMLLAIIAVLICGLNAAALITISDQNSTIANHIMNYQEAVEDGDMSAAEELHEEIDYIIEHSKIKIDGTLVFNVILLVGLAVVIAIIMAVTQITVVRPAVRATKDLNQIISEIEENRGDLTKRIETKSQDEIGQLVGGINKFIDQLQSIIRGIQKDSDLLFESADSITGQVKDSNKSAMNMSSVTEQLSASVEETTATLEQIASGSTDVLNQVKDMSEQAVGSANIIHEIKEKASGLKAETEQSRRSSEGELRAISLSLKAAMEDSRSIGKISALTDEILSISSQTNLLALNASIEAARAGEAGKGFAVVAEEIRQLADSSRSTANNIQEINHIVTEAVENLSESASKMLEVMNTSVAGDYDKFVSIAKQYQEDADYMNEILSSFSEKSVFINDTVVSMCEGLNDIASAMDESAKGITSVAEDTSQLVYAISSIQKETEVNMDISNGLKKEVGKFKQV